MTDPLYDRALLLHGAKRNDVLTLAEVEQYGRDSFADPDYVSIYGMLPKEWYGRGVRLLGRTAVECTRDPFAGSCNTLYWMLRHLPKSEGIAFELDPMVFRLTRSNIAVLGCHIELVGGDYAPDLARRAFPTDWAVVVFVAPPWGTALDEVRGLDLRRTAPPITEIISRFSQRCAAHHILFAIKVYEKVMANS